MNNFAFSNFRWPLASCLRASFRRFTERHPWSSRFYAWDSLQRAYGGKAQSVPAVYERSVMHPISLYQKPSTRHMGYKCNHLNVGVNAKKRWHIVAYRLKNTNVKNLKQVTFRVCISTGHLHTVLELNIQNIEKLLWNFYETSKNSLSIVLFNGQSQRTVSTLTGDRQTDIHKSHLSQLTTHNY